MIHYRFFTLTLALSPQGRGKSRNAVFIGGKRGMFYFRPMNQKIRDRTTLMRMLVAIGK